MGGLATGIITLAIGLAKHIPNEKHLILVQEDNQNSSFEEEYTLPKNLSVLKLKKFGPKLYPFALDMQKNINKFNPDVIYLKGLWRQTSLEAYYWKKKNPSKILIISPAGMLQPLPLKNKKFLKKLSWFLIEKRLLKISNAIHSVSKIERDSILKSKIPVKKNIYIPEGMIINNSNLDKKNILSKKLVSISRIDPIKGLETLLESCKNLDFKEWKFFIYGNGDMKYINKIKNLITKYKLEDKVILNDAIFGINKEIVLNDASAFILPSFSESFGIAIAEAMSFGIPVLTTTKTPWQVIKKKKLGWYVEPEISSLRKALKDLFKCSQKELEEIGARSKLYISKRYDYMTTSNQMKEEILALSKTKF
ncbi:Hypothetical protein P9515_13881 [Prochlorococcus marinus str. MIT 9515]|uniref:Glycosyl transferase family 1 domain-containing protein n=2 Tax=Prochlorococcus marinus TaxID=1219 RepID=A2BXT4_PROM5|nr:Hypothetical protein P9515_13881 [Prochlorococcus marinus str. MIT 9515]